MTPGFCTSTQTAKLAGIGKTLRTVFPPIRDGSPAMDDLLAAIERALARRDGVDAANAAGLYAFTACATPRVEVGPPELRA